ncbi:hypothetical protein Peur_005830 [Populus x canadensis]
MVQVTSSVEKECYRGRNGTTRSSCSYMCEELSQLDACIRQWKEKGLKVSGSVCNVSSQADRGKLINEDSSLFCGKLFGSNIPGLKNENLVKELAYQTPMRRAGEPGEVSPVVAFLCLPAPSFTTGQVICIGGGMSVNGFFMG